MLQKPKETLKPSGVSSGCLKAGVGQAEGQVILEDFIKIFVGAEDSAGGYDV